MTHILLTGAGFTHNWGGWLASETFEYLLGCTEIDDQTKHDLWGAWKKNKGFEDVLADYQQLGRQQPRNAARLQNLEAAIVGMFNYMNIALTRSTLHRSVRPSQGNLLNFLSRFDAIFTLNQDLFMEYQYLDINPHASTPRRWDGHCSPGVRPTTPSAPFGMPQRASRHVVDLSVTASARIQPYYKLHGSSNWYDEQGKGLLVMGGGKGHLIDKTPLLKEYFTQFENHIRRGDSRLFVIGYSFNDEHVTNLIRKAVQETGLKLFIMDIRGIDVLAKEPPSQRIKTYELVNALSSGIIGASRRPLISVFDHDDVELTKIMRFFA